MPSNQKQPIHFLIVAFCLMLPRFIVNNNVYDINIWQYFLASIFIIIGSVFILKNLDIQLFKQPVFLLWLLFLFWCAVTILFSNYKLVSWYYWQRLTLNTLIICVLYQLIKSIKFSWNHIVKFIILLTIAQAGMLCWQYFEAINQNLNLKKAIDSVNAFVGNKNIIAIVFICHLPFLLYGFISFKKLWKLLSFVSIFLSTTFIGFLSTRTAILGWVIIAFGFFIIYIFCSLKYKKPTIMGACINACLIFALSFSLFPLLKIMKDPFLVSAEIEKRGYANIEDRLATLNTNEYSIAQRTNYWKYSGKLIKDNPLIGSGYGTWQLEASRYEIKALNGFTVGVNAHNDFLEIAAETGMLGLVFYALIFLTAFINCAISFFKAKNIHDKLIAFCIGAFGFAYLIDAFFNFPLERWYMQLHFCLWLVLCMKLPTELKLIEKLKQYAYIKKLKPFLNAKILFSIFIFISCITIITEYKAYKNDHLYFKLYVDLLQANRNPGKLTLTENDLGIGFSNFPGYDPNAIPYEYTEAFYSFKSKNYEKAKILLNKAILKHPWQISAHQLLATLFITTKQTDSLVVQAKKIIALAPNNYLGYKLLANSYALKNQHTAVDKTMQSFIQVNRKDYLKWLDYADYYSVNQHNLNKSLIILDTAIMELSTENQSKLIKKAINLSVVANDTIRGLKYVEIYTSKFPNEAFGYWQKGYFMMLKLNYNNAKNALLKSIELDSKNANSYENLGICYYETNEFNLAIETLNKAIELEKTSKSIFYKGLCYYEINKTLDACANFKEAEQLGYQLPLEIKAICQ